MKLFSLEGKTALVTGCKRGIGKAMAESLAEAGADIIGVSANLELHGSDLAHLIENLGRKFCAYQCDFSDREKLYEFINCVKADHPKVDILVNNAGTILRAPVVEHEDPLWDRVLDVNLNAPFILSREIGKMMLTQRSGKIIFTSSLLSFQGGINVPGYAASKGAIEQLVKALSNEWASFGINVNAIAPGYIATDNTDALRKDQRRATSILSRIPQGRWGTPDDFRGPIVFLASAASNYMNGSTLLVDGGWMGR